MDEWNQVVTEYVDIKWSIPTKVHTEVAPRLLIPTQTWTLIVCFGRGFSLGFCLCFKSIACDNAPTAPKFH